MDVIKDYFPGKWRWLPAARYWSGNVHSSRDVAERLIKVFMSDDPLQPEAYRRTWRIVCGDHEVVAHHLHDACAKMHKTLYPVG